MEEKRAVEIVVSHGGQCLDPSDTRSVSDLRRALRSAGVKLLAASCADAQARTVVGPILGPRAKKEEQDEDEEEFGMKGGRATVTPCAAATAAAAAAAGRGKRCMIVGKHGSQVLRCRGDGSVASGECHGSSDGGGDGGAPVLLRDVLHGEPSSPSSSPCCTLPLLERGVGVALEEEVRAETVSLLWLESCHRVGEFGSPSECEPVFRPQPWPVKKFSTIFASHESPPSDHHPSRRKTSTGGSAPALRLGGNGGGGGGGGGDTAGRGARDDGVRGHPCVTVTGFKGAERSGWEQLILGMGAEMCRNLSKHVTTHLVCKKAEGAKYERALLWGVPVVTADWLVSCAQHGYAPGEEGLYHPNGMSTTAAGAAAMKGCPPAVEIPSAAPMSSADSSCNAVTPSVAFNRPGQSTAFEPPPGAPVETCLSSLGKPPLPPPPFTAEEKDKETVEGGHGSGVVSSISSSSRARGSAASAEPASTSAVPDANENGAVPEATSGLELQLRSMLSAGVGGGSGLSGSGGGGREGPPPATRRRLRLNVWGAARPAVLHPCSPGRLVPAPETKRNAASTSAGTGVRGPAVVSSRRTPPKLEVLVSSLSPAPPRSPPPSGPAPGVTSADGDNPVGLGDGSGDPACAAASSALPRLPLLLSTPPLNRGYGGAEEDDDAEDGGDVEDAARQRLAPASTSMSPPRRSSQPRSPCSHRSMSCRGSAEGDGSMQTGSAEGRRGAAAAAAAAAAEEEALAGGDSSLECGEVLSSPTAPDCRDESRGGRAALASLRNGAHNRGGSGRSDDGASREGRVRSSAARNDGVWEEDQENEPRRRWKLPETEKTRQYHTWQDHRRQQQQQPQQQQQHVRRNSSRDTRYGRTRQCSNKEGGRGGGARGVSADTVGGLGSPDDASAMMEEESQVVTYGEQYDPAAGWLR